MSSSLAKLTDTSSPLESRFNVFLSGKINRYFVTIGVQVQCLLLCRRLHYKVAISAAEEYTAVYSQSGKKPLQISLKQTFLKMSVQM